jgi:PKD repeat protein
MQGPASFPGMPYARPSLSTPAASASRRGWALIVIICLILVLIAASMAWLQWASQRGLALGYPQPHIQITTLPAGTLRLQQSYPFSADASGRDLTYTWNFGDQSGDSGSSVNHAYQSNGNFTVMVTVVDPLGHSSSASTQVTVLPPPPQATFTYSVDYDYVSFDASGSTADPSTSIVTYNWDFGDGSTDQTSSPQDYHYYNYYGTYQVTLTVVDGTGQQSSPYQVNVTI